MSEAILKAMMQLFALIVDVDEIQEVSEKEREIIRAFLSRQLNSELTEKYMSIFENYLYHYHHDALEKESLKKRKRTSLTAVRILSICEQINEELEQQQKIYVIIQLVEYIAYGIVIRETELEFLQTVATAFNIDEEEYQEILHFVVYPLQDMPVKEQVLLINSAKDAGVKGVHHIQNKHLEGDVYFLNIPSVNTYVLRYQGKEDLYLNGQLVQAGITYTFDHGASLRGQKINPIYYTDVAGVFSVASDRGRISFVAREVEFRFRNSKNGIHGFNLSEESGRLIGIMGGSGVGKSTLLNVLNGNLKPQQGEILINGNNLYDEKERTELKGVIGFIPQDDLLLEDLTVRQNLYYNAKLCLDNYDEAKLNEVVDQVLHDLDLFEIRDLKVGKPLNKVISGGQRKRVNIALELIREPSILFVDEPTSGLSSVDSEMVMNLLREQVVKGKLVIVNIHQPSSNLYKMFDRIIFMDKGGYMIYRGNPSEAVVYFKTKSNHANANEDQCPRCGNVDPDQVLQIIEAKIVNEHGKLSRTRKVSPKEWADLFASSSKNEIPELPKKEKLPDNEYSIPGLLKQINDKQWFEALFGNSESDQDSYEQGDSDHDVVGQAYDLLVLVRRSEDDPSRREQQKVFFQPVMPGNQDTYQQGKNQKMPGSPGVGLQFSVRVADASGYEVQKTNHRGRQHNGSQAPVLQKIEEWKNENIEGDIPLEKWVCDTEIGSMQELLQQLPTAAPISSQDNAEEQ